MTVQDLLDKVSAQGVGFYELKQYALSVRDSDGIMKTIQSLTIDEEDKLIKIKLKSD